MNAILVPTDFSKSNESAITSAITLAKPYNAKIIFINVVESIDIYMQHASMTVGAAGLPAVDYSYLAPYIKEIVDANTSKMQQLVDATKADYQNIEGIVVEGVVHQTICDKAVENACDVIVMGTHGSTGIEEIFIGSNAQKVVRFATVPVLTIKAHKPITSIDSIAFVSNFDEVDFDNELVMIQSIASKFHAQTKLVYVNTPANFDRTIDTRYRINDFILSKWPSLNSDAIEIINDFSVEEGVANFVKEFSPSIVVVFTHGRKGLNRVIHYNITESLVNHLHASILCNHFK